MAKQGISTVLLLVLAVYLFTLHCSVVGQTTNSTSTNSSNSTNTTIRVCNGTILVITLPIANGYPWFYGFPPIGGNQQQFGPPRHGGHGGRGRG